VNILKWARVQWDRVTAWVLIGLGGIAILLGWNGVSREALTTQQVPYIVSGGIGGLFLLGVGAMFWISADLRDEWRKLDAIERNNNQDEDPTADPDDPFQPTADSTDVVHELASTDGSDADPPAPRAPARQPRKKTIAAS
jgi:hypothetical protein